MPTNSRVEKLDDLARSLAGPMPRRRALRLFVVGFFGLAVTSPRPGRAGSHGESSYLRRFQLKNTPCIDDMCSRGKICGVDSLPNKWGQTGCIKLGCCQGDQFCCAGPATVHGAVGGCCSKGFNCDDGKCVCNGTLNLQKGCDCPPARVCGPGCCKPGDRCIHDHCCAPAQVCGPVCCKPGERCVRGQCCSLERPCGSECDCSHLKQLQAELRNAEHLQQAFRNKIPELRTMNNPTSKAELQRFAKTDARRGLVNVPGYNGPTEFNYESWGDVFTNPGLPGTHTDKELCAFSDDARKLLDQAKDASACAGVGAALEAHEQVHMKFCLQLHYGVYFDMHGADRAQEEVEAYGVQISMLRDVIKSLTCP